MTTAVWRRLRRAEARLSGTRERVAGVDEAGRGPLAGPIVAAAVVLSRDGIWDGLNDSKQMTPEARVTLFSQVLGEARAFAWSVVGPRAIDFMNIRRAAHLAMARAVAGLRLAPDLVLIDGHETVPGIPCEQVAVVDGDARLLSIAAASVLAKVVRDRIMGHLDSVWPQYGFGRHKGYGTPEHLDALARLGPCPLHRYSFRPVCTLELPLV